MRAGLDVSARAVLTRWFLHEWYEDWDVPAAESTADDVLRILAELPVHERMDAMGMRPKSLTEATTETAWVTKWGGRLLT